MTDIDFYILAASEPDERAIFTCRLVEKAFKLGHKIYIHTNDEDQSHLIDDRLWDFRADSFIPHNLVEKTGPMSSPVEIGHNLDPENHSDLLINLASELPGFFSRFHRVSEIVIQHPEILKCTREHFIFYRDRGYAIKNHDLRKK
jgi:DNA polymerase-3 subunit chi